MIKFNNNNLLTGFIKQKLKDFNLPKYRVLRPDMMPFEDCIYLSPGDNQYILKGNSLGGTTKTNILYRWGKPLLNITKNLTLINNIYDYYTHEYLGDYLRFVRDSKNINLMSLYNCCSNNLVNNLEIKWLKGGVEKTFIDKVENTLYKIYMIPAKFYEKYTIGIDSDLGIEIIAGFYSNNSLIDIRQNGQVGDFYDSTYLKVSSLSLNNPILYDKIYNLNIDKNIYLREKDLKIFIKVPFNNKSSLVMLEGNFIENKKIQLLYLNTEETYPFSNRFIEYITGNVITPLDTIEENIKIVKTLTDPINILDKLTEQDRELLYNFIISNIGNNVLINTLDILGYYDKEAEALFRSKEE